MVIAKVGWKVNLMDNLSWLSHSAVGNEVGNRFSCQNNFFLTAGEVKVIKGIRGVPLSFLCHLSLLNARMHQNNARHIR